MRTQLTISRLGHQGDGVADGPIYAPRTLPGEIVSGVIDGAQLTDIRIESPSPQRVQAPCRHYKSCGGCQLQHASDGFLAEWKQDIVRTALAAQGLEAPLRPIHTSPPHSRRRATLAARRTKKGATVGFHGRASDVITEIPDCHLLDPALLAALPMVESLARAGASRKTPLAVTLTASETGLDVLVREGKPLDGPLRITLAGIVESHDLARLTWGDELIAMARPPVQRPKWCRRRAPFCRPRRMARPRCAPQSPKSPPGPRASSTCSRAAAPLPCLLRQRQLCWRSKATLPCSPRSTQAGARPKG